MTAQLTFYSTSACHLCELAEQMLALFEQQGVCSIDKVDIANSDVLLERYGIRIPVVRNSQGEELGWPFSPEQVLQLMA